MKMDQYKMRVLSVYLQYQVFIEIILGVDMRACARAHTHTHTHV